MATDKETPTGNNSPHNPNSPTVNSAETVEDRPEVRSQTAKSPGKNTDGELAPQPPSSVVPKDNSALPRASDDVASVTSTSTATLLEKRSAPKRSADDIPLENNNLSPKRPSLGQVAGSADLIRSDINTLSAHFEALVLQAQAESEKLKKENAELKAYNGEIKAEREKMRLFANKRCFMLTKELTEGARREKALKESLEKLEKQSQMMQEQLNNPRNTPGFSDEDISHLWNTVSSDVQQLSRYVVSPDVQINNVPTSVTDQEGIMELRGKLQRSRLRKFLIQQYVWVRVCEEVFWGGRDAWGNSVGLDFLKFSRALKASWHDNPSQFSKVRALAAQGLDEVFQTITNKTHEEMIQEMITDLSIFIAPDNQGLAQEKIRAIFTNAFELFRIFLTSRALFETEFVDLNSKFDDEMMAKAPTYGRLLAEERVVKLAISPFLRKYGNAEGENFDSSKILCKAGVVLS